MDEHRVIARAKVNLALHVTGQLPNGMHLIDSLVAFPDIGDILVFRRSNKVSLSIEGLFGSELLKNTKTSENIVLRAAKLILKSDEGVSIKLIKNLPIAAGIGGGSTDAASTIRVLSKLFNRPIPNLDKIAKLGADLPVCMFTKFQRVRGVGEIVRELPVPAPIWIVLANPGVYVSTEKVFNALRSKNNTPLTNKSKFKSETVFFEYLAKQRNDLEAVTCSLVPEVEILLELLKNSYDCKVSRMSGSGATCFGLYLKKDSAEKAVSQIRVAYPNYWVKMGRLFSIDS